MPGFDKTAEGLAAEECQLCQQGFYKETYEIGLWTESHFKATSLMTFLSREPVAVDHDTLVVPMTGGNDDDVFYLFLQKQNLGDKLHIYL